VPVLRRYLPATGLTPGSLVPGGSTQVEEQVWQERVESGIRELESVDVSCWNVTFVKPLQAPSRANTSGVGVSVPIT
jgi:hypothetical protein